MPAPRSSSPRDDIARLRDIRESARLALDYVTGKRREDLDTDTRTADAVVRRVLVIGEAARLVSETTRSLAPAIPWTQMVGARHILVHEYWRADLDAIWRIATEETVPLLAAVESLLTRLEAEEARDRARKP